MTDISKGDRVAPIDELQQGLSEIKASPEAQKTVRDYADQENQAQQLLIEKQAARKIAG